MQDSVLYFFGFPPIHSKLSGKLGGMRYATIKYRECMEPLCCCPQSAKQAFWIIAHSPGVLCMPVHSLVKIATVFEIYYGHLIHQCIVCQIVFGHQLLICSYRQNI